MHPAHSVPMTSGLDRHHATSVLCAHHSSIFCIRREDLVTLGSEIFRDGELEEGEASKPVNCCEERTCGRRVGVPERVHVHRANQIARNHAHSTVSGNKDSLQAQPLDRTQCDTQPPNLEEDH